MNRTPNLTMLKPATEYAESIARLIDVKAYMNKGNGMYRGLYDAWSAIASHIFENMDIPMSACGTIGDIIAYLEPQKRRMNVRGFPDSCSIEHRSGSDKVHIDSFEDGSMTMTFQANLPYWANDINATTDTATGYCAPTETVFDISHYGPDSIAALIIALFRSHRILLDRFRKYAYR